MVVSWLKSSRYYTELFIFVSVWKCEGVILWDEQYGTPSVLPKFMIFFWICKIRAMQVQFWRLIVRQKAQKQTLLPIFGFPSIKLTEHTLIFYWILICANVPVSYVDYKKVYFWRGLRLMTGYEQESIGCDRLWCCVYVWFCVWRRKIWRQVAPRAELLFSCDSFFFLDSAPSRARLIATWHKATWKKSCLA